MKRTAIAAIAVILFGCNAEEKKAPAEETKAVVSSPAPITNMSGYDVSYSKSFEIGDSKNAETLLALWKNWDDGTLDAAKALFADSVNFYTSDGTAVEGPIDSAFASMKAFRGMYTSIKSSVDAILPVKSTDKNENWVLIWGKEISTDKKGKTDSVYLQETWRFNKDGKIDLLYQHSRVAKPAGK